MSTDIRYELEFGTSDTGEGDRDNLVLLYEDWRTATAGDSNDDEQTASFDLIEALMEYAGITVTEEEFQKCDECDEEAEVFWPKLVTPVQMCRSCEHNARRSGWEPGQ